MHTLVIRPTVLQNFVAITITASRKISWNVHGTIKELCFWPVIVQVSTLYWLNERSMLQKH